MAGGATVDFGDFPEYFYTLLSPDADSKSISVDDAAFMLAENAGVDLLFNKPGESIQYTPQQTSQSLANFNVFKTIASSLPNQFLQKQSTDAGDVSPLKYLNVTKLIVMLHDDPNWASIQKQNNLPDLEPILTSAVKSEQEKIKASYVGSEAAKNKLVEQYKNNNTWFNYEGTLSVQSRKNSNDLEVNPTSETNPIDNLPPASTETTTPPTTTPTPTETPTDSGTTTTTVPTTTESGAPDLWSTIGGINSVFDEQKWLQENTGATLKDLNDLTNIDNAETVDQTFDISGLPSSFKTGLGSEYSNLTSLNISAALRYPYQLDKQGIMDLQDNLRRAGWYDRVGASFTQHGVLDPATETAYQTFMADSVRAGITPAKMLEDGLTNYVRNRAAASGVVYRDDIALHQQIRDMGSSLIGRGLTTEESDTLIQQIRRWEETAALGQTFSQDNYQVDIDAKAQNAIETQFKAQYMSQMMSDALKKAGKA